MNEKERIELLMKCYELTPSQFADKVGVQRASISHIISGRNKPSLDVMLKIYEAFPGLDMKWLMTGDGEQPSVSSTHSSVSGSSLFPDIMQGAAQYASVQTIAADTNRPSVQYQEEPIAPKTPSLPKQSSERQPKRDSVARVPAQQPATLRKIKEIRIFYTDGTYETLVPEK